MLAAVVLTVAGNKTVLSQDISLVEELSRVMVMRSASQRCSVSQLLQCLQMHPVWFHGLRYAQLAQVLANLIFLCCRLRSAR